MPAPLDASDAVISVELKAADVPFVGLVAEHCWLVINSANKRDRWEVWQHRNVGGEASWGYLHKNLLPADTGVGAGPSHLVETWCGPVAGTLARRIERSPRDYPWRNRYFLWPGPNSNTWVQWVLSGERRLGWKARGRFYALLSRTGTAIGTAGE